MVGRGVDLETAVAVKDLALRMGNAAVYKEGGIEAEDHPNHLKLADVDDVSAGRYHGPLLFVDARKYSVKVFPLPWVIRADMSPPLYLSPTPGAAPQFARPRPRRQVTPFVCESINPYTQELSKRKSCAMS